MSEFTQTWPSEYCDQVDFIEDLLSFTFDLDIASRSVFLFQPTEPTSEQLDAAWDEQVGAAYAIPPGAKLFWFDSANNVIDNVWETTYEISGVSNGTLYKIWDKRKTLDISVLNDTLLEDDASSTIAVNPLDQSWSNLLIFLMTRTAGAGTSTSSLQTQTTGGVYGTHLMDVVGTPAVASSDTVFTHVSFTNATISIPNNTAPAFSYRWEVQHILNYSQTLRDKMSIINGGQYFGAAPFTAANRRMLNYVSGRNTAAAITSLTLLNTANALKQGTRLTIYGMR